jgi:hypothetical protein
LLGSLESPLPEPLLVSPPLLPLVLPSPDPSLGLPFTSPAPPVGEGELSSETGDSPSPRADTGESVGLAVGLTPLSTGGRAVPL